MGRCGLIALALAVVALPAQAQAPRITADGTWRVVEVAGRPLAASDGVSMTFAGGQVSGLAGCNRFFGGYSLLPGFTLAGVGTTRMACAGRAGEVEAAFLAALAQVNDWRLEGETGLDLLLDDRALVRAVLEP